MRLACSNSVGGTPVGRFPSCGTHVATSVGGCFKKSGSRRVAEMQSFYEMKREKLGGGLLLGAGGVDGVKENVGVK